MCVPCCSVRYRALQYAYSVRFRYARHYVPVSLMFKQAPGSMCVLFSAVACVGQLDFAQSCVGHRNMAAFIRFLVLVDIGCAMHLYKVSTCAFGRSYYYVRSHSLLKSHIDTPQADPTTSYMIILILNYATSFPVLLAVGCFTIYHLFCVLSNSTTIEGFEKEKVASLRRRGRIADDARYPFHLGIVRNLRAVFGDDIWLWCWPLQQSPGNGLHFPVGRGIGARFSLSPLRRREC